MIPLHPHTALLLYLLAGLLILFTLWLLQHFQERKRAIRLEQEEAVKQCEYCLHRYLVKSKPPSQCPKCSLWNL